MFSHRASVPSSTYPLVVDLNAPPYAPEGLNVVQHLPHPGNEGLFVWHQPAVNFSRDDDQLAHDGLNACILRERLLKKPGVCVFNANLLDFLAHHPAIIPKEKAAIEDPEIVFFGTIYADVQGALYMRTLRYVEGSWVQSTLWLGASCNRRYYAALWNENWLDQVSLN